MNLYRVVLTHYAPKDRQDATACFVIAKGDADVYNLIRDQFQAYGDTFYVGWDYKESEVIEIYDSEYNVIDTETRREYYLRIKGQTFDEDFEPEDTYYGVTTFGWELFKEDISENDANVLLETGVAIKV